MFSIFRKNENSGTKIANSDEYERLSKKLIDLSAAVAALAGKYEILETNVANLRGKLNQRLRGREDQSTDPEKDQSTASANPSEGYLSNELPIG